MMPTTDAVRRALADALHPRHFFVGPALRLAWAESVTEEISWEIFRGRLLDAALTRERRTFESCSVYEVEEAGRAAEPLLSLKWDVTAGRVYVVRAVRCYAYEAYDVGGNVIQTREVRKWVRELVGDVDVTVDDRRGDLARLLFRAVVGTSRLPLTSLEAPLPAFSFGQLAYFPSFASDATSPASSARALLERAAGQGLNTSEKAKLLEAALRAATADEVPALAPFFGDEESLERLLGEMFNDVSLSPYTDFVAKALRLAERALPTRFGDFCARLLRLTGRHLTAYDLVLFHHKGANYPDALLLDEVLTALLDVARRRPEFFAGADARMRRRGLRQAWLLREGYRGLAVPDAPTSPGENARVLPTPRIAEDQLVNPAARRRHLFDSPLAEDDAIHGALAAACDDLDDPRELRELGTALYLDRPFGAFLPPGTPDTSILLSYVAWSRSVAGRRLELLRDLGLIDAVRLEGLRRRLADLPADGLSLPETVAPSRPGAVALADARKVADDFVLLATTRRTAEDLAKQYEEIRDLITSGRRVLAVGEVRTAPAAEVRLVLYDATWRHVSNLPE